MGGLVLGISGFFGIQFFQENKLKEAEMASQLYSKIEFAVKQQRLTQALPLRICRSFLTSSL